MLRKGVVLLLIAVAVVCWHFGFGDAGDSELPGDEVQMIVLRHKSGVGGESGETSDGIFEEIVEEIALEEALVGFVAAEMPASYAEAALMAQAVAARSFVMSRFLADGEVCDDSGHCLAYCDEAGRKERWGRDFAANEAKIRAAVAATAGEVLVVEGMIVAAYFHAVCGGMTESAAALWGGAEIYPAAECLWDGGGVAAQFYGRDEVAGRLEIAAEELPLLCVTARTASGRVREVSCGSRHWSGAEVRRLLGLASANFCWLSTGEGYYFSVLGSGHGVGMCQKGAGGMAAAGYDYREILARYYGGCKVVEIVEIMRLSELGDSVESVELADGERVGV